MDSKNALHSLIHSMNNNEKRYFQLFSTRHTIGDKNNYVKLFDVIAKQEKYDDKEIKRIFSGTSIGDNLRVNKHYLYQLILKSLNSFHVNSSTSAQLREMIASIEVLFEKGLYEQCTKIIFKANKLAVKYENQSALLELLKWEYHIMVAQFYMGKSEEDFDKSYSNTLDLLDQIKRTANLELVSSKVLQTITKTGRGKNENEIIRLKKLIAQEIFSDDPDQSYGDLFTIYQCKLFYYQMILNDKDRAYHYITLIVQLMEERPHFANKKPIKYAFMLLNLANAQMFLKKFKALELTFEKLWELAPRIKSEKNKEFLTKAILSSQMAYNNVKGAFDNSIHLLKQYEGPINEEDLRVDYVTHFNTANAFFGLKNYKMAINYVNKIINQPHDYRDDTQCMARILNLIIHYEIGNMDLLEYAVKSTYRFILKKKKLYAFETLLMQFIRKSSSRMLTSKKATDAFIELKTELEKVIKDPDEKIVLESVDAISWLESKIENKPFDLIIKEKAKKYLQQ